MSAARRNHRRRDWPAHLYEPRPGYYVWRHPDGKVYPLGRIPLALARNEALAANAELGRLRPSLVERMTGGAHTVAELLGKLPVAERQATASQHRSIDRKIIATLGKVACADLSVQQCAELVESIAAEHPTMAQQVRGRLIVMCARGRSLGWMHDNPAEVTQRPAVTVQRGRLTLESFNAILARAPEVSDYLPLAMRLALVTGQDRSTIAAMQQADVRDGCLYCRRSKTGTLIAIPVELHCQAIGVRLSDLLKTRLRDGLLSPYLIHHTRHQGRAKPGDRVSPDRVSLDFAAARELAGITGDNPPTFHEIRSLSSRLYKAQPGVDVQALLGHSTAPTTRCTQTCWTTRGASARASSTRPRSTTAVPT